MRATLKSKLLSKNAATRRCLGGMRCGCACRMDRLPVRIHHRSRSSAGLALFRPAAATGRLSAVECIASKEQTRTGPQPRVGPYQHRCPLPASRSVTSPTLITTPLTSCQDSSKFESADNPTGASGIQGTANVLRASPSARRASCFFSPSRRACNKGSRVPAARIDLLTTQA